MTKWTDYLHRAVALLVAVLFSAAPAGAQEFEKNILTGGATGTYIQIGRDLSREMERCGLTLNVRESAGSLENFLGVRTRPNTQFGIVQSDVLEYLKTYASDDPSIARAIHNVRIAFPLYNEEVHVLARRDIADLQGLNGKRVAVGTEASGTFLTASLVLDLAGVTPAERVTTNPDQSLPALLAGDVDALFYVAGAPTQVFQSPEIDPEQFHLLPIADPTLQAVYVPSRIEAGTYPFQSEAIDLIAVKAVLMTYEYNPRLNAYHRESCKAVSDLSNVIITRFPQLQETGHPKWQGVDLNDLPPGWDVSECVNAGLEPGYGLSCAGDQPAASTEPAGSAANAAYRERICAVVGC
jgi:TRAP transporter TAXI family solute receptor